MRLRAAFIFLIFALGFGWELSGAEITSAPEYPIKAACLYNFTRFVEWPKTAFADAKAPIVLGVIGKDPFGPDLDQVIRKGKAKGRSILIKRFNTVQDAKTCHILFVPATEEGRRAEIFKAIEGLNVLTVGETDRFTESGGAISLISEATTRITVNMDAVERARLVVRSQVLKFSTIIRAGKGAAP